MNGMCVSPTTTRHIMSVSVEKCGDNNSDSNDGINQSTNNRTLAIDPGSTSSLLVNDDTGLSNIFRKSPMESRHHSLHHHHQHHHHSRTTHGIRKLQKCLSTSVTNYETDLTAGLSSTSVQHSHGENRNLTSASQTSTASQSILNNVRQYSSFGIF